MAENHHSCSWFCTCRLGCSDRLSLKLWAQLHLGALYGAGWGLIHMSSFRGPSCIWTSISLAESLSVTFRGKKQNKTKLNCVCKYHLNFIMSLNMPLAKASHITKPQIKEQRSFSVCSWTKALTKGKDMGRRATLSYNVTPSSTVIIC